MLDFLKRTKSNGSSLVKHFFVRILLGKLDAVFAKLPMNDAKMINGLFIAVVGAALTALPQYSPILQPLLDYLHTLPHQEIIASGLLLSTIGASHKAVKMLLRAGGEEPAKQVVKVELAPEAPKVVQVDVSKSV